jgi:8-oxo-dGTP pyrophosphatase MutT (NUDIX family)
MEYKSFASGYLVRDGKVLLVHHNKLDKWVPPGGHVEQGETPAEAVAREFFEETSLQVKVISAFSNSFVEDANCVPLPLPFHMGIYREGFDTPHIGYFYFVASENGYETVHQKKELLSIGWFGKDDMKNLKTFKQVKAEVNFVLDNYPKKQ